MTLVDKLLIVALLAQVGLSLGLMFWLGRVRVPLVASGKVRIREIALDNAGYPEKARQISNAVDNQFQLPMLFYVAAILGIWSGSITWLEVILAWAFVALRFVHAYIHTTNNNVVRRFGVFVAGLTVLSVLWLDIGLRLLLTPGVA